MSDRKIITIVVCSAVLVLVVAVPITIKIASSDSTPSTASNSITPTPGPDAAPPSRRVASNKPAVSAPPAVPPPSQPDELTRLRAENAKLKQAAQAPIAPPPPAAKPVNLKGGAWVVRGTGSSDLLRGLSVHLCKPRASGARIAVVMNVQADDWLKEKKRRTDSAQEDRKKAKSEAYMADFYTKTADADEKAAQVAQQNADTIKQMIVKLPEEMSLTDAYTLLKKTGQY